MNFLKYGHILVLKVANLKLTDDIIKQRSALCISTMSIDKIDRSSLHIKWAIPGLLFFIFSTFQQLTENMFMSMTGFEPQISGMSSDRSASRADQMQHSPDLTIGLNLYVVSRPDLFRLDKAIIAELVGQDQCDQIKIAKCL